MVFTEPTNSLRSSDDCCTAMTSKKNNDHVASLDDKGTTEATSLSSFWRAYQSFVCKHHMKLELADGAMHRLLFWLPHHDNSGDGPPWREVLYGLLSVNQLAMHLSQQQRMENSYGFSVRTRNEPIIPATSLRIALQVIHCLMPSLLEIVGWARQQQGSGDSTPCLLLDNKGRSRRQAQLRLRLEQLKCAIRLYLLSSYWKQFTQESSSISAAASDSQHHGSKKKISQTMSPGIMLDGGIYQPMEDPLGISAEELHSRQLRRSYRGRRTGLRISKEAESSSGSHSKSQPSPLSQNDRRRILVGELLYILRPVWWAAAEARHAASQHNDDDPSTSFLWTSKHHHRPLFNSWLVTLGMELVSLGLLSGERRNSNGNPFSKEEWNRRRMKLFLYLLRAPVWNQATSRTLERTSALARRVPLVGGLLDSYIWDWILYWKHPYVSEEG